MQVLLFAALRELAGTSRLDVEAADDATVGTLLEALTARFGPDFGRIVRAGAVVVDGETVGPDRLLSPGQEVALLPPVSGGGGS